MSEQIITSAPYVYRLRDRITGKMYIGSRYAQGCAPEDLGVTYFTSSKTVRPLFKADPARFEKQIMVTGDVEYVRNVEVSLIDLHDAVMSEDYYNRANAKAFHPEDNRRGGKIGGKMTGKLNGRKNVESGHMASISSAGGKIGGRKNVESGHIQALGKSGVGGKIGGKIAGKINGRKAVESGQLASIQLVGAVAGGRKAVESGQIQALGKSGVGGKIGGKVASSLRYTCACCGLIRSPGPMGWHQKLTGHTGVIK